MKLKFRVKKEDFIIFCVFCGFLFLLVCVLVTNLDYFLQNEVFYGLNPLPALMPRLITFTLLAYAVTFYLLFFPALSKLDREKGFGIVFGTKKKDPDGYSKWLKEDEVKKLPNVKKVVLKNEHYDAAGIPLLLNKNEAYVDDGEYHSMVIGSTGSGKTQCLVIPMIRILARAGESMVVADLKGELYQKTATMLKELGYKVIVLNFRDPLRGNAWNPLQLPYDFYVQGQKDKAMELIDDLGSNIIINPKNNDNPFWEQTASSYFSALAIGLLQDGKPEEINLNSISMMATMGEEKIGGSAFSRNFYDKEYFLSKGELSNAYVAASATVTSPSETKGSIMSTFRSATRLFSSRESLSEMLSYSDFDFSSIGKEKTIIYMVIHDEKKTYHSLLSTFIKQAYESLVYEASKCPEGKLPIRTNLILDEFANMPAIADVDAMFTAARSRNIRMSIFVQNFAQLNQTYGREMAETIKANCLNWFFLMTAEYNALDEISKLCGTVKGKKGSKDNPLDSEPDHPLVTVTDLQQMEQFEILIKRSRALPFKSRFATDFELKDVNAFDCSYELYEPEVREKREVKVFNLKEYVDKYREEHGLNTSAKPPAFNAFNTPTSNLNSGMSSPNVSKPSDTLSTSSTVSTNASVPTANGTASLSSTSSTTPVNTASSPVSVPSQNESTALKADEVNKVETIEKSSTAPKLDIDEYLKTIDKKVEELETDSSKNSASDNNDVIVELEEKQEIEKPKVNIDVDSIIVDDNITDDQFFDDFFGDDE